MGELHDETVSTAVGVVELRRSAPPAGGGEPIVYLHSATGEGAGLTFLERLADRAEVVAPVFPGFGASEGIEHIDDIEDAAFHLIDLWDRLALGAPAVVGLSLGGWLALELATRWPERVGRLVLVNPVGLYLAQAPIADIFGRPLGALAEDLFADQDHPLARALHGLEDVRSDPEASAQLPFDLVRPLAQTMAATARLGWDPYLHNPKLRPRLHRVTQPTLVVRSGADRLLPAVHAETYAAELPDARLHVLPGAGHLVPLERPDEVAAIVADFVTDPLPAARAAPPIPER
jgi:pimeloyl-ACP methyl ester carboxylesterase